MKKIFFATLILITSTAFAQTEKSAYKAVTDSFSRYYNDENYTAVFNLFNDDMKKALPADKTTELLTGLQEQVGNILNREFKGYENTTYATYKTQFANAVLALNISVDNNGKINGLFIKPYTETDVPTPSRNITKMKLPFNGEWTVIWGGDTKAQNYHVESPAQKNAFDIVITDSTGKSYKTNGKKNEDYYAFGKPLFAPCDATVVMAVDGVKDNVPGTMNPIYIPGNSVLLKTVNNEYILMAHFKQFSVKVKEGQKVKAGQLLGLCGNSGNSSEPHLHFHLQNVEDMTVATGIKCHFEKIFVNGVLKKDYSPVQHEKIKN